MICNHIFNVKLGLETNTEQIPAENVNDNIYYRCNIYILFHAHYTVNRTYISNIYVHLFCNFHMTKKVFYCCSITQSGLLSPNVITSAAWDKVVTPLMFCDQSLCWGEAAAALHNSPQTETDPGMMKQGCRDSTEWEESWADQDQD